MNDTRLLPTLDNLTDNDKKRFEKYKVVSVQSSTIYNPQEFSERLVIIPGESNRHYELIISVEEEKERKNNLSATGDFSPSTIE